MNIKSAFSALHDYCERNDWRGYDPYDGLNCRMNQMSQSSFFKLALVHLNKNSIFNLRKLLAISPGINSKGIALFLSGAIALYRTTGNEKYSEVANQFIAMLKKNVLTGYHGPCWGYYFPWQSRAFYIPANTPSVVVTSFVARALLEAYEVWPQPEIYALAQSSQHFILQDLKRTYHDENFCLSYTPQDHSQIYNASLLGGALLAQLNRYEKSENLTSAVRAILNFCVDRQNPDGSWYYGAAGNQLWVDHYHTGFMLEALLEIHQTLPELEAESVLRKGFRFYVGQMFEKNVIPKFHHNQLFPIEPHCGATAMIVLSRLAELYGRKYFLQAEKIADWFIQHMFDAQGYFYFQQNRLFKNKISYMRWVQAWMFKALAFLLAEKPPAQSPKSEHFEKTHSLTA